MPFYSSSSFSHSCAGEPVVGSCLVNDWGFGTVNNCVLIDSCTVNEWVMWMTVLVIQNSRLPWSKFVETKAPFDMLLGVLITNVWPLTWPSYWRKDLVLNGGQLMFMITGFGTDAKLRRLLTSNNNESGSGIPAVRPPPPIVVLSVSICVKSHRSKAHTSVSKRRVRCFKNCDPRKVRIYWHFDSCSY